MKNFTTFSCLITYCNELNCIAIYGFRIHSDDIPTTEQLIEAKKLMNEEFGKLINQKPSERVIEKYE